MKNSKKFFKDYNFNKIQIAFVVDTTGSMDPYIQQVKEAIESITANMSISKFFEIEFAFVGYRDHHETDEYVVKTHGNKFLGHEELIKYIKENITAKGGGDLPEAVLDGLHEAAQNLNWKKKGLKFIFHVADAPPHGKMYAKEYNDKYPEGCPLGHTANSVFEIFKERNINYCLIDCSPKDGDDDLYEMEFIFRKKENYGKFNKYDLDKYYRVVDAVNDSLEDEFNKEKNTIHYDIRNTINGDVN